MAFASNDNGKVYNVEPVGLSDTGDYPELMGDSREAHHTHHRASRRRRRTHRTAKRMPDADNSSLGSSETDEEKVKTKKKKHIFSVGFAIIATVHAAHGIHGSIKEREARYNALEQGHITHEEAHRLKNKARIKDLASLAIAALGVQQAYSEIREAEKSRHEWDEMYEMKAQRHQRRLAKAHDHKRRHRNR